MFLFDADDELQENHEAQANWAKERVGLCP
jgi:hypothetical protein